MENERWEPKIFKLPQNHGWTARPGNKIVVADRGALRFEIPQNWVVAPSTKSVETAGRRTPQRRYEPGSVGVLRRARHERGLVGVAIVDFDQECHI